MFRYWLSSLRPTFGFSGLPAGLCCSSTADVPTLDCPGSFVAQLSAQHAALAPPCRFDLAPAVFLSFVLFSFPFLLQAQRPLRWRWPPWQRWPWTFTPTCPRTRWRGCWRGSTTPVPGPSGGPQACFCRIKAQQRWFKTWCFPPLTVAILLPMSNLPLILLQLRSSHARLMTRFPVLGLLAFLQRAARIPCPRAAHRRRRHQCRN
jgi:hypothetical protein